MRNLEPFEPEEASEQASQQMGEAEGHDVLLANGYRLLLTAKQCKTAYRDCDVRVF